MTDTAINYAARYGHNIAPIIKEITLRERIPLYGENKRELTNAKRRLKAIYKKIGWSPNSN